jgi:hypothetical protein
MSIISIQHSKLEQEYWSQIWGYIQPNQTICYDPTPPLYCPPPLIQEVRYAIH